MELQETSSDALNESMWLDQPPSPSYQQLSPTVQQNGRNVIANQQISVGYQVPDPSILWNEKHESPRNSPDTNEHSHHDETRGNSQASTSGYHFTSSRKRPCELNQIHDLDRKYIRRDGSTGSNVSLHAWSSRQVDELAQHLVADLDGPLSAITTNELVNAVASYNMSLNHVSQRNINGPYQSNGNIGLLVEPDSNNSGNNIANNNVSTTTTTITTTTITPNNTGNRNNNNHNNNIAPGYNHCNGNNGREQVTNFHSLLYSNKEDFSNSPSAGNHVSSSQQEYEFNGDNRFQYVLGAATSMAIKLTEETLTYLNQGQPYELKLKKLGDLSAYRGRTLKSTIKICFHERRLQYTERERMLAWQDARPGERLLEVDEPLSYGMIAVTQSSLPINTVEITWDPTKEANVYIKINCISTEFTAKKHGGEKGVPFRIQVETTLCNDFRLHAASCQIKVFKLKGADRKHKQDHEKIRRKSPEKQDLYQPSCECTVLSEIPLNLLPPTNSGLNNQLNSTDPNNTTLTRSLRSAGGASPSDSGQDDISEGSPQNMPTAPSPALILPDLTPINDTTVGGVFELPENANPMQTAAWLRANGLQKLEATFKTRSARDLRSLTRRDLIEICGLVDGILLYNRVQLPQRKLYFSMDSDGMDDWKIIYLRNLTSEALTLEIIKKFNISYERLHSVWVQGPHNIRIVMSNEDVEHMEDRELYLIEIIKDSPNDNNYKLLLKPFNPEDDVKKNARVV
ncbi:transcription factor CP2 isoform X2 [Microplitis mediator]|uniref:transcription factor CP2 isoform X2 n=1 Tax=Microplitis mediator TaxID=375433 RepID=UPI00255781D7|nr:transcription factor CP2 isoform X2 [Microplitis mediator]